MLRTLRLCVCACVRRCVGAWVRGCGACMPCVFALNLTGCQPQDTTIAEISDERGLDASMYLTHLKDCGHFCIFLFATMGIWLLLVAVGRYCQSAAPRFHFDRCFNRTWERVPAS